MIPVLSSTGLPGPGFCVPPVPCPAQIIQSGGGIGSSVAGQTADVVFQGVADGLNQAADWLIGHVVDLIVNSAAPRPGAAWFAAELGLMEQVALAVVLPVLMAATIGPVLRQDGRRLVRVWGVGLPIAVLSGLAASQFAAWLLSATDALCGLILGGGSERLGQQFSDAMAATAGGSAPVFVQMILSGLTVVGAVLVWLELMVRSAGVYVATFFMPIALVGYIWPATAGVARRAIEVLVSLILSKFVILASVSLGLAALTGGGIDATVSGAAVLLIAAFAPFALLRLAPVVEASAIAHLEGMARRPVRAAARTATAAAGAPVHPVTQAVMSMAASRRAGAGGDGGGLGPAAVTSQPIPWHPPDFPGPDATTGTGPEQAGG